MVVVVVAVYSNMCDDDRWKKIGKKRDGRTFGSKMVSWNEEWRLMYRREKR